MKLRNGKTPRAGLFALKFWVQLCTVFFIWVGGMWLMSASLRSGFSSDNIVKQIYEMRHSTIEPRWAPTKNLTQEEISALLAAPSPLRGYQRKAGMIDPKEWDPELDQKRKARFGHWISYLKEMEDPNVMLGQPPIGTTGCQVFVNHDYRFFWIKTRKTGGTSLRGGLGWICEDKWLVPKDANKTYCATAPWRKERPQHGDPETWWKNYFVFATVRNPYSRFASAYAFMNKMNCPKQTFGESCRDPFLKAKLCTESQCCRSVMGIVQHMMEQSSCLFTKDGEMAVDYIAQSENLDTDFAVIAREINKRRKPGVPPLKVEDIGSSNVNGGSAGGYEHLFQQFPECVDHLNHFLERELRNLQYLS